LESSFERIRVAESVLSWLQRPRRKAGSADLTWLGGAIVTAAGEVRPENQDRAIVARYKQPTNRGREFLVTILCDGMGGMVDGGQCADIAVSEFLDSLVAHADRPPTDNLRQAALSANQAIFRTYRGRGGTTLTAALFTDGNSAAVSVGDTRLFEISQSKELSQISVDDTIAGELRRIHGGDRQIDLEPFSNRLAQYVGMGDELQPRIYPLARSNWYLTCTDGVQSIPADTIQKVVRSAPTVYGLVQRLVNLSIWCGGEDNASAICVAGDRARSLVAENLIRQVRLEIWDPFGSVEVLFSASQPQARAVATGASTAVGERAARPGVLGANQGARDWKRSDSPKSKRTKKTESKTKRAKPQKDAAVPSPPKQFEMEIVESAPSNTTNGSDQANVENKK
jgi:serine/threonine protein phosphatase PrpC